MKLNKTFPFVVDFIHFKYDLADLDQETDFYEEILYRHFCKKQLYIRIKILKNSYLQYNEMQITRYENSFKGKKSFYFVMKHVILKSSSQNANINV